PERVGVGAPADGQGVAGISSLRLAERRRLSPARRAGRPAESAQRGRGLSRRRGASEVPRQRRGRGRGTRVGAVPGASRGTPILRRDGGSDGAGLFHAAGGVAATGLSHAGRPSSLRTIAGVSPPMTAAAGRSISAKSSNSASA